MRPAAGILLLLGLGGALVAAQPTLPLPTTPATADPAAPATEAWIASFAFPLAANEAAMLAQAATVVRTYTAIPAALVLATQTQHEALLALPFVERLDRNDAIAPDLDRARYLMASDALPIPSDPGLAVAIVDSGLDLQHPGLGTIRAAVTLTDSGAAPGTRDEDGHGTFVASVVAGTGQGSPTQAYAGIAPGVPLVMVDLGSAWDVDGVLRAFDWILQNHKEQQVRIVLASLGRTAAAAAFDPGDPLVRAADALHDAGLLVVVSGGNRGPGPASMGNHALNPNVLTVGSVDAVGRRSDFSALPPAGFAKPDVDALGEALVGAHAGADPAASGAVSDEASYEAADGTSGAAAVVAGVAARAWLAFPEATVDDLLQALRSAVVASPLDPGVRLLDGTALQALLAGRPPPATTHLAFTASGLPDAQGRQAAAFPVHVWATSLTVQVPDGQGPVDLVDPRGIVVGHGTLPASFTVAAPRAGTWQVVAQPGAGPASSIVVQVDAIEVRPVPAAAGDGQTMTAAPSSAPGKPTPALPAVAIVAAVGALAAVLRRRW